MWPGWGDPVCIWGEMWCGDGCGCMRGDGLECGGCDCGRGDGCGDRTWLASDEDSAWFWRWGCGWGCGD